MEIFYCIHFCVGFFLSDSGKLYILLSQFKWGTVKKQKNWRTHTILQITILKLTFIFKIFLKKGGFVFSVSLQWPKYTLMCDYCSNINSWLLHILQSNFTGYCLISTSTRLNIVFDVKSCTFNKQQQQDPMYVAK